jgi:hypothetical protein
MKLQKFKIPFLFLLFHFQVDAMENQNEEKKLKNGLGEDINTTTYYKLSSLSANAYVGFKFIPAHYWRIYLLGNIESNII